MLRNYLPGTGDWRTNCIVFEVDKVQGGRGDGDEGNIEESPVSNNDEQKVPRKIPEKLEDNSNFTSGGEYWKCGRQRQQQRFTE